MPEKAKNKPSMRTTYSAVFFLQEINNITCVQALPVLVLPVPGQVLVLLAQVLVLLGPGPVLLGPGPVPPPLSWQAQPVSFQVLTGSQPT